MRSSWPQPVQPALSPEQIEAMRRRAWQQQGIVHCLISDLTGEWAWLELALTRWANERYGVRDDGNRKR